MAHRTRLRGAALLAVALLAAAAQATSSIDRLSLAELDEQLQACPIVQELNSAHAHQHGSAASSSLTARLLGLLFPSSRPAVNALLATLYISGSPNMLLALCPADLDPSSLRVMVAFAVGGLLGDTLFHLLPEIFVSDGDGDDARARFVLVEPNRNLLLGLAILVGFMNFVAMDKALRIATGGAAHDHGHDDHGHARAQQPLAAAKATGADAADGEAARSRKKGTGGADKAVVPVGEHSDPNPSVKLGGYLNLVADFTHNITDGLAMAASFYASPTVGATTTVAVFFHEIPHEVGDFALLVQLGFSKRAAMASQFVTALGALLGTLMGIAVQELGGGGGGGAPMARNAGIWGTSLAWGDMLLPFTAGAFLYVGTVAAVPELLETAPAGPNGGKGAELRRALVQLAALAAGAGIMLYVSWHD